LATTAEDVARNFWSALRGHDVGRALSLLADDAVFHAAGLPPANGRAAVEMYLTATHDELGSPLETIALYDGMLIAERIGHVVGEGPGQLRVIVSLARVNEGLITSWQDFFDPLSAELGLASRGHRYGGNGGAKRMATN
jgi:limonene-1,2-epoxide hydrolase